VVVSVLVVLVAGCAAGGRSPSASAPRPARLMAAVLPTPPGCSVASTCAPRAAGGVALAALPSDFGLGGPTRSDQLDADNLMFVRTWRVSKPTFLNPGGEPVGATISVQVTNHPSEGEATALGLDDNPRPPSPMKVGPRSAYVSTWTISTVGLDGTTPMDVQAVSIYLELSDTVRVQVNTMGIDPDLAQLVAGAVVVQ
jgi:hypothetical protein